jgi:DNA polymerase III gamma/tau subunit
MAINEEALMWVEKYRPKTLDDVVGLKDIVDSLKAFMKNPKIMPHLMLAGIPGTGKTTIALCIAPNCTVLTGETLHSNLTLQMKEALILCATESKISHVTVGLVLATFHLP